MSKKKKNSGRPKKVQAPVIPDKLPYTKGEKTAEIIALVSAIAALITQLVLLISGMRGTGVVVTAIFTVLEYGAFTYGSAVPHKANVALDKSMITEQVFGIDGIGRLAYQSLRDGDIPFVMGYNLFLAILTIIGTLFSDIMYSIVDPRVKLGK